LPFPRNRTLNELTVKIKTDGHPRPKAKETQTQAICWDLLKTLYPFSLREVYAKEKICQKTQGKVGEGARLPELGH
jgi:hypothetical protein